MKRFLGWLLFATTLVVCIGVGKVSNVEGLGISAAQAIDASILVQQGVEHYQAGAFQTAIEEWQSALTLYRSNSHLQNTALVLENLARAYQQLGQTSQELQSWQQASQAYRQLGDQVQLGRMLTEQAQAYRRLGQPRQAIALLCDSVTPENCALGSALQIARETSDRLGEVAALGSLGEAYYSRGDYPQAIAILLESRRIAEEINHSAYLASALNALGIARVGLAYTNYRQAAIARQAGDSREATSLEQAGREQDTTALGYFQQSLAMSQQQGDRFTQLRTLVNSISAYYRTGDARTATATLQRALALLETLPDSQLKVYAAIDLTHLLQPMRIEQLFVQTQCPTVQTQGQAADLLQQAIAIAQRIGDRRSESFALGEWGHFYECQQNYSQALVLTQQARWAAEQELRARDSLYLWEWQTGRLLKAQGKSIEAIAAYERAVATLETIRSELLAANRDLQFDFRDAIDPVYRELVELRLEQEQPTTQPFDRKANLDAALKTLDALRLAELQNYFGEDCAILATAPTPIDSIQQNRATAVFSSVILNDRTAIIVSFPDGRQQLSWIEVDRDTLSNEINQYRRGLERFFRNFNSQQAVKIYNWMIAPFVEALEQAQVKTLVFVQDGILRSVPMAALYDGQNYLIQKYAIATTPSLALTDATPLNRRNLRVLALGLTQATQINGQNFPALTNVDREIQAITAQLPGSKPLLDQDFTSIRLQEELIRESYPIIHIATHGQFETDPENTFLVTGDQQKLTIRDLDAILRRQATGRSIELLSLTACQTATGNDRAALGLAGVAIQAGARSALASLWSIDDATTVQIATQFYANLKNNLSKAEALQQAQIAVIEAGGQNARPAFWSPFILIGNWL